MRINDGRRAIWPFLHASIFMVMSVFLNSARGDVLEGYLGRQDDEPAL